MCIYISRQRSLTRGMAKDTVTVAESDDDHMMDPKPVKRKLPARHVKVTKLPANQEAGGSGVGGFNAESAKAVSPQGRQRQDAELEVKKIEQEIAGLPTAPGYNQDVLSLLDDQITAKRRELECPICFEECAPPIYTCTAQHLVCAKCR